MGQGVEEGGKVGAQRRVGKIVVREGAYMFWYKITSFGVYN